MANTKKPGLAKVSLKSLEKTDSWTLLVSMGEQTTVSTFYTRGALYNALRVLNGMENVTVAVERSITEAFEVSIDAS